MSCRHHGEHGARGEFGTSCHSYSVSLARASVKSHTIVSQPQCRCLSVPLAWMVMCDWSALTLARCLGWLYLREVVREGSLEVACSLHAILTHVISISAVQRNLHRSSHSSTVNHRATVLYDCMSCLDGIRRELCRVTHGVYRCCLEER